MMAGQRMLIIVLLGILCLASSQDDTCGNGVVESHGRAIVFLQQLRPITVPILKHLAVEICHQTLGSFYFQVWRNETVGEVPQFKLIWQYLVDREDPTQVNCVGNNGVCHNLVLLLSTRNTPCNSWANKAQTHMASPCWSSVLADSDFGLGNMPESMFTIPERLQLDLTGLTQTHISRLFFGVTAPTTTDNPTGKVPVRRYFSADSQSLSSMSFNDTGRFVLGETRQFIELYWPYFFVLSLCSDGNVTRCSLPVSPALTEAPCGIPGSVVSNISEVPFRGKVKAIMVDFCSLGSSLEVVLLEPVRSVNVTSYHAVWRSVVTQKGSLKQPTIVNVTMGPTIGGTDYHLVVRSLSQPTSDGARYIPVRSAFDPSTPHTRTHVEPDVPKTLRNALNYPYFLPVTLCENNDCENPREQWAQDAVAGRHDDAVQTSTTVITPTLGVVTTKVTVIEWPPFPGPAGAIGIQGLPGAVGFKGDTGDLGPQGPPGPTGPLGPPGYDGQNGDEGFPGYPGVSSERGSPGLPGEPGTPGMSGDDGIKGPRGDDGKLPAVGASIAASSSSSSSSQTETSECTCSSPLQSPMLVLGLIIWAILLSLLVILLLVVTHLKVRAEDKRWAATPRAMSQNMSQYLTQSVVAQSQCNTTQSVAKSMSVR